MRAARGALLFLLLFAGCTRRCKDKTLYVTVNLGNGSAAADTLTVTVTVAGGASVTSSLPHKPGAASGQIEIQFPNGYPSGKMVTVNIDALSAGVVLATGTSTLQPGSGCDVATVAVNMSAPDMSGDDMAMEEDLAGVDFTPPPSCTLGMACMTGSDNGLCDGTSCNPCTDVTDDANCVSVYGAGQLCINGGCLMASCRTASDCGGKPCVDYQCSAGCSSDNDCSGATPLCNTGSGVCVANSCTGQGVQCSVNPADVCCSSMCLAGSCCASDPCAVPPSGSNNGTCMGGTCVLNSCTPPSDSNRYVDPAAPAGGSGTMACPFNDLGTAVNALAAAGGTVIIKAASTLTLNSTPNVAPAVNITGADGSYAPCTASSCDNPVSWPTINLGFNGHALNYLTAGTRKLHFLNINGPTGSTSNVCGIYASNAGVAIDHVHITAFNDGICPGAGSTVTINAGVTSNANLRAGLSINTGGVADVELATGDVPTSFDGNTTYGIYVQDTGKLTVNGPGPYSGSVPLLISASSNRYGVRIYSTTGVSITGLKAQSNVVDGIFIYAKSIVKLRKSHIYSNQGSGIHVAANGTNTTTGLADIDLGADSVNDPGLNTLATNTNVGICVDAGPADAATNFSLRANGNTFGSLVCTGATGPTITKARNCTGGYAVAADCAGPLSIASCTAPTCIQN
jgi:hypothetical protein